MKMEEVRGYIRYETYINQVRVNVDTHSKSREKYSHILLIDGEYHGEYESVEDAVRAAEVICQAAKSIVR